MRWQGRRGSENIEDRRRMGAGRAGGLGLGGVVLVLLVGYFFGVDVTPLLNGTGLSGGGAIQSDVELTEADQRAAEFVSVTLADTEEIWSGIFRDELGATYEPVTLVLFKQVTQSPCGNASGATGPFYCPLDKKVYLDTDFFAALSQRMGAGGDFAAAYVVAHEVAHHVQDELGILGKTTALRQQSSEAESNAISVRVELQADCFSGLWARHAHEAFGTLEKGDIAEAMNAAEKIGDDTLMRNAGRRPMPDSFTHGTSEQRQRWFATGFESGSLQACDTFAAANL
ncbi:MAG: neutral zinc metallopeptidase [Rhodobacteraceae bacterium]|jgi:predicted metalloprotease|uniref:KPN_02809 family neutral zinc metallopeptidase n=1 Tax=Albidovulum sp. TaxID=1872424 RepID=UPI001D51AE96|nr:neutral zinc metallopeptidase [uncultured Defluviimonas sp.]MCB2125787.1 neutral zinc metallopeptidase [Paracoccaceae bacterium]MCC0068314.1 neutral zinc metallopeptidase [Paracoccaceae bacterium]